MSAENILISEMENPAFAGRGFRNFTDVGASAERLLNNDEHNPACL